MTYLIRLTLILVVICASATAAIWLVGHTQPLSRAVLFTNPDSTPCAQPCLFGIRPGQTSEAEANALLRVHPLTRYLIRNLEGDIFHDETVCVILNRDSQGRIDSIRLARSTDAATFVDRSVLDQVVNVVGEPDLVVDSHLLALTQSSSEAN